MGHSHHHHDHSEGNIKIAFFLNLLFSIIEIIGGLWTNSVAILSDAIHDLGDSFTLGISWYFAKAARKKKTHDFTYGYKRLSVIGALISSIVLVTGSIFVVLEAIPRLINPVNPNTEGMIYLALGGVIVNGLAAFRLSKGHSVNERAVFNHMLEDVLGWVATLIGALVMHFSYFPQIDPILSILIALFILYNVYKNLKESFHIILQGTPSNVDIKKIRSAILEFPEVKDLHDCHAWSMDGNYNILSVHLVVNREYQLKDLEEIKTKAKARLQELGINHATIEFETEDEVCEAC
ncbi:MAG: cation diffusion facilitator family transporter [Cyclobacteriaceae bacterium]